MPQVITADRPSFKRIAEATLVLIVLIGALVVWSVSRAGDAAQSSEQTAKEFSQQAQRDEIQACRGLASTNTAAALSEMLKGQADFVVAVGSGNRAAVPGIVNSLKVAEKSYAKAIDAQVDASTASMVNPKKFLADCRRQARGH